MGSLADRFERGSLIFVGPMSPRLTPGAMSATEVVVRNSAQSAVGGYDSG